MKEEMTAKDVMNHEVLTCRDDATVAEVATFLADHDISGVPLVNATGRPVGFVSFTDIAEMEGPTAESEERPKPRGHGISADEVRGFHVVGAGRPVREIMTPTVYTIPEETRVDEIARTLIAGRIHRLFVTRGGRIVGLVTPLDLLKLLAVDPRPAAVADRAL